VVRVLFIDADYGNDSRRVGVLYTDPGGGNNFGVCISVGRRRFRSVVGNVVVSGMSLKVF